MKFAFFFERVNGGDGCKVGEHQAVVAFELEAWPEPKALQGLMKQFRSTIKAAKHIGVSQAIAWDKLSGRKWDPQKKAFKK